MSDAEVQAKVGTGNYYLRTIRVFKLNNLEDICENYGPVSSRDKNVANPYGRGCF